ncbi:MAG: hypothetical protein FJZ16_02075, partial [Candidatus Omnitrophica bacterium]|nr:hypothetical protein [Candidatus Omnitrophota bacterium]
VIENLVNAKMKIRAYDPNQQARINAAKKLRGMLEMKFSVAVVDEGLEGDVKTDLEKIGIRVLTKEQYAQQKEKADITIFDDRNDSLKDSDAAAITTEWSEFRFNREQIKKIGKLLRRRLIFDSRNLIKPKDIRNLGFRYISIGRPDVEPNRILQFFKSLNIARLRMRFLWDVTLICLTHIDKYSLALIEKRIVWDFNKLCLLAALSCKATFAYVVSEIAEKQGANADRVLAGMVRDKRIGRGRDIEEEYFRPGPGIGGPYLMPAVEILVELGAKYLTEKDVPKVEPSVDEVRLGLLTEIVRANTGQIEHVIERLNEALKGLNGKNVGIIGLSYRAGKAQTEGSGSIVDTPSLEIITGIWTKTRVIKVFDPDETVRDYIRNDLIRMKVKDVNVVRSIEAILNSNNPVDAILILTADSRFKEFFEKFDFASLNREKPLIIYDTCNILNPAKFQGNPNIVYMRTGSPVVPNNARLSMAAAQTTPATAMRSHLFPRYIHEALRNRLAALNKQYPLIWPQDRVSAILTQGAAYYDPINGRILEDEGAYKVIATILTEVLSTHDRPREVTPEEIKEIAYGKHEGLEQRVYKGSINFAPLAQGIKGKISSSEFAKLRRCFLNQYAYPRQDSEFSDLDLLRELTVHLIIEGLHFGNPIRLLGDEDISKPYEGRVQLDRDTAFMLIDFAREQNLITEKEKLLLKLVYSEEVFSKNLVHTQPIEKVLYEIKCDKKNPFVIVRKTASGKSTCVPIELLLESLRRGDSSRVFVVQPRVLGVILLARYINAKMGFPLVGQITSKGTVNGDAPILMITDGELVNLAKGGRIDPKRDKVIVDEFHAVTDLMEIGVALCLHRGIYTAAMSATIEPSSVVEYLSEPERGITAVSYVEGKEERRYPLEHFRAKEYFSDAKRDGRVQIEDFMHRYIAKHLLSERRQDGSAKSALVFVNKVSEVEDLVALINSGSGAGISPAVMARYEGVLEHYRFGRDKVVAIPLYAEIVHDDKRLDGFEAKIRYCKEKNIPFVIVATNVAEMSITLDIDDVITLDTEYREFGAEGRARLEICPIRVNSYIQRAGRCGRLRPGRCFLVDSPVDDYERQYVFLRKELAESKVNTAKDLSQLEPEPIEPPLQNADLKTFAFTILETGIPLEELKLMSKITPEFRENYEREVILIKDLGLADKSNRLTPLGRTVSRLSLENLHYATLLARGLEDEFLDKDTKIALAIMCAFAENVDFYSLSRDKKSVGEMLRWLNDRKLVYPTSDLITLYNLVQDFMAVGQSSDSRERRYLESMGLSSPTFYNALQRARILFMSMRDMGVVDEGFPRSLPKLTEEQQAQLLNFLARTKVFSKFTMHSDRLGFNDRDSAKGGGVVHQVRNSPTGLMVKYLRDYLIVGESTREIERVRFLRRYIEAEDKAEEGEEAVVERIETGEKETVHIIPIAVLAIKKPEPNDYESTEGWLYRLAKVNYPSDLRFYFYSLGYTGNIISHRALVAADHRLEIEWKVERLLENLAKYPNIKKATEEYLRILNEVSELTKKDPSLEEVSSKLEELYDLFGNIFLKICDQNNLFSLEELERYLAKHPVSVTLDNFIKQEHLERIRETSPDEITYGGKTFPILYKKGKGALIIEQGLKDVILPDNLSEVLPINLRDLLANHDLFKIPDDALDKYNRDFIIMIGYTEDRYERRYDYSTTSLAEAKKVFLERVIEMIINRVNKKQDADAEVRKGEDNIDDIINSLPFAIPRLPLCIDLIGQTVYGYEGLVCYPNDKYIGKQVFKTEEEAKRTTMWNLRTIVQRKVFRPYETEEFNLALSRYPDIQRKYSDAKLAVQREVEQRVSLDISSDEILGLIAELSPRVQAMVREYGALIAEADQSANLAKGGVLAVKKVEAPVILEEKGEQISARDMINQLPFACPQVKDGWQGWIALYRRYYIKTFDTQKEAQVSSSMALGLAIREEAHQSATREKPASVQLSKKHQQGFEAELSRVLDAGSEEVTLDITPSKAEGIIEGKTQAIVKLLEKNERIQDLKARLRRPYKRDEFHLVKRFVIVNKALFDQDTIVVFSSPKDISDVLDEKYSYEQIDDALIQETERCLAMLEEVIEILDYRTIKEGARVAGAKLTPEYINAQFLTRWQAWPIVLKALREFNAQFKDEGARREAIKALSLGPEGIGKWLDAHLLDLIVEIQKPAPPAEAIPPQPTPAATPTVVSGVTASGATAPAVSHAAQAQTTLQQAKELLKEVGIEIEKPDEITIAPPPEAEGVILKVGEGEPIHLRAPPTIAELFFLIALQVHKNFHHIAISRLKTSLTQLQTRQPEAFKEHFAVVFGDKELSKMFLVGFDSAIQSYLATAGIQIERLIARSGQIGEIIALLEETKEMDADTLKMLIEKDTIGRLIDTLGYENSRQIITRIKDTYDLVKVSKYLPVLLDYISSAVEKGGLTSDEITSLIGMLLKRETVAEFSSLASFINTAPETFREAFDRLGSAAVIEIIDLALDLLGTARGDDLIRIRKIVPDLAYICAEGNIKPEDLASILRILIDARGKTPPLESLDLPTFIHYKENPAVPITSWGIEGWDLGKPCDLYTIADKVESGVLVRLIQQAVDNGIVGHRLVAYLNALVSLYSATGKKLGEELNRVLDIAIGHNAKGDTLLYFVGAVLPVALGKFGTIQAVFDKISTMSEEEFYLFYNGYLCLALIPKERERLRRLDSRKLAIIVDTLSSFLTRVDPKGLFWDVTLAQRTKIVERLSEFFENIGDLEGRKLPIEKISIIMDLIKDWFKSGQSGKISNFFFMS